ncbi:transcriptional regulator [Oleiphilus messinensis]|uniref:Transcriptional regulator n=1 Tax=Oleiphilus messinensis TaxID=141451 RepID=A0A1Y0IGI8_9GAMM|nr:WYL domain-containing protein [Oleiphilus messinensis]ARU59587.1 transcriptional regulator [Oleiphilus messinensis]
MTTKTHLDENIWPLRWDLLMRYRLIEIVAQWEGRLTTNHLCNSFGIGRQQASKDINQYLKEIGPENLIYDKHLKGYKPTENFTPKLTTGTADEYLHVLSRNKDIAHTFSGLDLGLTNSEVLQVPIRNIKPHIIRPLVQAAREKKRVEIDYISLNSPIEETRVIAPHTLVCTPLRWHIRAYCEKNRGFRDFVLSRFRGHPEILTESTLSVEDDERWNRQVEIIIQPDSRLSESQKSVISHDYGMVDGQLKIETRAALITYTLQALNLDPKKLEAKAEAQQIIIANLNEIESFLFS